jgi:hypothetical protein
MAPLRKLPARREGDPRETGGRTGPVIDRIALPAKEGPFAVSNGAPARRGGARTVLVAGLAIVAVILGFLQMGGSRVGGPDASAVGAPVEGPASSAAVDDELVPAAAPTSIATDPGGESLAPFDDVPTPRETRTGRGSLRGRVDTESDAPFPLQWTLHLEPSLLLDGSEGAVERHLEIADGRREFAIGDLPFGAYDVKATAEGFNGWAQPIRLEAGNEHPYLFLRLTPTGFLEGLLLDPDGTGAGDVIVTLIGASDPTYERVTATDAGGLYRFDGVPDGPYELIVGLRHAPLLERRRPLSFKAPSLTFPPIELPPLASLELRVIDSRERPLVGVEVRGSGSRGGQVEGLTDHLGELAVQHLPAGRYRLRLVHPGFGEAYERRTALDLVAGETQATTVRLGP